MAEELKKTMVNIYPRETKRKARKLGMNVSQYLRWLVANDN